MVGGSAYGVVLEGSEDKAILIVSELLRASNTLWGIPMQCETSHPVTI